MFLFIPFFQIQIYFIALLIYSFLFVLLATFYKLIYKIEYIFLSMVCYRPLTGLDSQVSCCFEFSLSVVQTLQDNPQLFSLRVYFYYIIYTLQ